MQSASVIPSIYTADESTLTLSGSQFLIKNLGVVTGKISTSAVTITKCLGTYAVNDTNVLHSFDTQGSTNSLSYVKIHTMTISGMLTTPSTLRIKFDMALGTSSGYTAYGKIYKNGSGFGTERTMTSNVFTTYSEDLSFANGDTIEIWSKISNSLDITAIRNFRIYGSATFTVVNSDVIDANFTNS